MSESFSADRSSANDQPSVKPSAVDNVEEPVLDGDLQDDTRSFRADALSSIASTASYVASAEPGSPLQTGQKIGRYALIAQLGQGGFGVAWRAFDESLRREVAIKLPRADRLQTADQRREFFREAQILAQLDHPHVLPVFDCGEDGEHCFVVSKLAAQGTLADRLQNRATIEPTTAALVISQLADGLHTAHLQGIIHRDIKPGNIFFGADGHPLLGDFGLAVSEAVQTHESPGLLGTVRYMSPEQAAGESNTLDARSDIFSLGVVLYEMLTGRLPYLGRKTGEYLKALQTREARPPSTIVDTIPRALEAICLKCLRRDLHQRYTSAKEVAEELRQWLTETAHPGSQPESSVPAPIAPIENAPAEVSPAAVAPAKSAPADGVSADSAPVADTQLVPSSTGTAVVVPGDVEQPVSRRRMINWLAGSGLAVLAGVAGLSAWRSREGNVAAGNPAHDPRLQVPPGLGQPPPVDNPDPHLTDPAHPVLGDTRVPISVVPYVMEENPVWQINRQQNTLEAFSSDPALFVFGKHQRNTITEFRCHIEGHNWNGFGGLFWGCQPESPRYLITTFAGVKTITPPHERGNYERTLGYFRLPRLGGVGSAAMKIGPRPFHGPRLPEFDFHLIFDDARLIDLQISGDGHPEFLQHVRELLARNNPLPPNNVATFGVLCWNASIVVSRPEINGQAVLLTPGK